MIVQLNVVLNRTTAQVVETSVTVNSSPIQDYVHLNDHAQPTYKMTPVFKPFTIRLMLCRPDNLQVRKILAL